MLNETDVQNEICLTPFATEDLEAAFKSYEENLGDVIDRSFGWNDDFQRQRSARPCEADIKTRDAFFL
jgi:hypothetical protein